MAKSKDGKPGRTLKVKEYAMRRLLIKSAMLGLTLQLVLGVSGAWASNATEVVHSVIERALE